MAPKAHTDWTVLRHGPIEKLAENLWRVKGSLPGMSLERVMTVVRRDDGSILLHSVIALQEDAMREIESYGPITTIIVPNAGHRLDAPAFKTRYPNAQVYCPKAALEEVAKVVEVDGVYEDFPADETIHVEGLHGIGDLEAAFVVSSPDGVSVILNDCVANQDRKRDMLGFIFTTLMGSAPGPRVSRFGKMMFVKDQGAFREDLERLARLPNLRRLIVSHDKVAYDAEASAALLKAAACLRAKRTRPGTAAAVPGQVPTSAND